MTFFFFLNLNIYFYTTIVKSLKNSQQNWNTDNQLMTDRYSKHVNTMDDTDVINQPGEASNVFNEYFINMAAEIGQ
jgi:hypothetical protein